jgi:tetratricopeptide (TPR) repeat protein
VRKSELRNDALFCVFIALCTLCVYSQVLTFDFITLDDPEYVTSNPRVRAGLSWQNLQWAFTHSSSAEWHPLTMLSHMADCQFFGTNAKGHHTTNLLLHLINVILLFGLLRSLTGTVWRSALVAVLFAIHPLNVETVAWISERKGLLSAFFGIICLWAFGRYAKSREGQQACNAFTAPGPDVRPKSPSEGDHSDKPDGKALLNAFKSPDYLVSVLTLAAGLLCKPTLITWPFVMLLLDFWPLCRIKFGGFRATSQNFISLVVEKLPFFFLSLLSCVVAVLVGKSWGALTTASQTPLSVRLANSAVAYCGYVRKLLWPENLSIDYLFIADRPIWEVVAALSALLLITLLILTQWKSRPFLLAGWLWYLGTLVPVIGLVHFGNHFMADRYAYLTTIGLFIGVVWLAAELVSRFAFARLPIFMLSGTIAVAYAACTRHQLRYWANSETLFKHALTIDPKDFMAFSNLGFYYDTHGKVAEAEQCYREVLSLNPSSTFAIEKLATILVFQGNTEQAINMCQRALALDPGMADAHCTLGLALAKRGLRKEALDEYETAIRIRPDFAPAHYNMANILASQGKFLEAISHYKESLVWDPDSPDAHNNLAYLLARDGKLDTAAEEFLTALKLKPRMWQAEFGLADVFKRQARFSEAIQSYRKVLSTRPDLPEALCNLAWIEATTTNASLRNGPDALALSKRACGLTGDKNPNCLRARAVAYAETGDFKEAIDSAQQVVFIFTSAGQLENAKKADELLKTLSSGKPYRE